MSTLRHKHQRPKTGRRRPSNSEIGSYVHYIHLFDNYVLSKTPVRKIANVRKQSGLATRRLFSQEGQLRHSNKAEDAPMKATPLNTILAAKVKGTY